MMNLSLCTAQIAECPWFDYCGADSLNITGSNSACTCNDNKPICGPGPWFNCINCEICPTCKGCPNEYCNPLNSLPNTNIANGNLGTCNTDFLRSGSSCSISCNTGYSVNGSPYSCNKGSLTGSQTCNPDPCSTSSISEPSNGNKGTCSVNSIASGSSCSIACNDGYSVNGIRYSCQLGKLSGSQNCQQNPPPNCVCRWSNFCGADSCGTIGGNSACRCRNGDVCSGAPSYNCGLTNQSNPYSNVDLIIDRAKFLSSIYIEDKHFDRSGCAYEEGIIDQVGTRRLLRFSTQIHNVGSQDFILGTPWEDKNKELFEWSACHAHFHLSGWSDYVLLNSEGNVVGIGHKQGFCIRDSYKFGSNGVSNPVYNCDNQGLSTGWGDLYENTIDGQWIDITGIPSGAYTLKLTVNPSRRFPEANFDNNSVQTTVHI